MQLMPATAARYGVTDPGDPAQNIDAGVRHLKDLLNVQHQGNVALALAAYNAGQGAVARHGGRIPPYRETMLYVPAVLAAAARGPGSDQIHVELATLL
jgi:soluble lytic murein transglycosylase-like protein